MSSSPVSYDEQKWQADSDARTLADAEVIQKDEKRLKRAQEAAVKLAKEAQERADAFAHTAIIYDRSPRPPKKWL